MDSLHKHIVSYEQDWLADLRALVGIDCGTGNKAGVDAVGRIVTERCAGWGFEVTHYPQREYGDCHAATLRGKGQGRIMLMGHLDTVYFDGTVAELPVRIDGRRLYAPGAGDMKGGLLNGMYAMRALQQSGFEDFESITFFFNSEEEQGSPVSQVITQQLAASMDAALVFEPARANGAIVSARKASGKYSFRIAGRSAHAGVAPEKGINAVLAAARLVEAIAAQNACVPGVTVTPTVIHGGTAGNVVPDACEITVDCRSATAVGMKAVDLAMKALAAREYVPGATVTVTGGFSFPPMEKNAAVSALVDLARSCAEELDFDLLDIATGGASDASIIAPICPVLDGLGPVCGNMHNAREEYIELNSIVPRTALAARLIQRMLEPQTLEALREHKR